MSHERLVVHEVINSSLAVSSEKAQLVFNKIRNNIDKKIVTVIDFSNIKSLTTAFLNVAIGELYKLESRDELNKLVTIDSKTLSTLQKEKVKMVMTNSRDKYSKGMKKKFDEVALHGETDWFKKNRKYL